jgi:hypothetical protein
VQKYTVQQHDKISVNCVEQPNTYTIYNLETQQALIRVEEQSECCTRCFCAPDHSVVLQFNALDPSGNAIFPVITMEREGCCSKPCLGGFVCMDCCANEAFIHAGSVVQADGQPGGAGKLPRDRVIGRAKVPILGGGLTPTIQVMDRTPTADHEFADHEFARVIGPTLFRAVLCCDQSFAVKRVNKDGSVSVDVGDIATITKKPKSTLPIKHSYTSYQTLMGAMREKLIDSDLYELEVHDPAVTPQHRATLIGTLLMMDYMFFERDSRDTTPMHTPARTPARTSVTRATPPPPSDQHAHRHPESHARETGVHTRDGARDLVYPPRDTVLDMTHSIVVNHTSCRGSHLRVRARNTRTI